jgi:porin
VNARRLLVVAATVVACLGMGSFAAATETASAQAEPASIWPRQDYTGDLLERRYLTGDWGGWRTKLADRGVTLNVDLLQAYRGVVDGGRDENDAYGGSADYELHVETARLGLWPGGFLRVFAESRFGKFVNADTGTLIPADTDGVFPLPEDISTLTSVGYVQFLAPWVAVLGGKLDTLDGDQNAFASGRGKTQFSNLSFVLNPAMIRAVPYSALGGGVLFVLPDELGTFQVTALDAGGRPDVSGFEDAFDEGTVVAEELRVGYRPLGLPGHATLGGAWSSRNFAILDQDRRLVFQALVDRRLGTDFADVQRTGDTWAVFYNFDQFLYVEKHDPTQGVGLFFRFAQGDERNNPIERFYSFGVGGKGVIPTRDEDTFGAGWYLVDRSDQLPRSVERRTQGGQGFEMFYNAAVLPWLHVTPDLQVLQPTLERADIAVVLGTRMQITF